MKLEKYKEDAYYFSGKLSEINRYFSFAGIAIIWIFKTEANGTYNIPPSFILPLILLSTSLLLDFLQYAYSASAWIIFYRHHESKKQKKQDENKYKKDDIKAPRWISNISYFIFYIPKILANIAAYFLLLIKLWSMLC